MHRPAVGAAGWRQPCAIVIAAAGCQHRFAASERSLAAADHLSGAAVPSEPRRASSDGTRPVNSQQGCPCGRRVGLDVRGYRENFRRQLGPSREPHPAGPSVDSGGGSAVGEATHGATQHCAVVAPRRRCGRPPVERPADPQHHACHQHRRGLVDLTGSTDGALKIPLGSFALLTIVLIEDYSVQVTGILALCTWPGR